MAARKTATLVLAITCVLLLAAATVISASWILRRVHAAYQKARMEELQRDESTARDLANEFEKIMAPRNDVMIHRGTMIGLVQASYKSTLSFAQLKIHYNEQLVSLGWRYLREDPIIYDGHDYGGKQIIYCKPPYAASLEYAGGLERQFGSTYTIGFSSGLHKECK